MVGHRLPRVRMEACRQQTHDGAERISLRPRREARLIDHEARSQRQPRIKRPQCDVGPGSNRLTKKCSTNPASLTGRRRHCCAGITRRLAQVAATAAIDPAARSAASAPVSTSQKPKNPAAREIALPSVPGPFRAAPRARFAHPMSSWTADLHRTRSPSIQQRAP